MSHQGEPGQPGFPGEEGTGGGGRGGTGGQGGRGGDVGTAITRGARYAVLFLFALTVVLAAGNLLFTSRQVNSLRALDATANRNTASITQLCVSSNELRVQQLTLWSHIITISRPPPHETAAQERARLASLRAFEAYIRKVFAVRNCHAITH